jgi:hypothetical protein
MGIETFMCEPKPEQLDRLDKLANEYGINVVELRQATGSIDVLVDGKPFTSYIDQMDPVKPLAAEGVLLTQPVLFPLRTPAGITVTT